MHKDRVVKSARLLLGSTIWYAKDAVRVSFFAASRQKERHRSAADKWNEIVYLR
jgi:hypothetical protein